MRTCTSHIQPNFVKLDVRSGSASGCCFTLGCFQNQRIQINFNDSFDETERTVLLANLYKQLFFQML